MRASHFKGGETDGETRSDQGPVQLEKRAAPASRILIVSIWVAFTAALVGWIIVASLSTTREIFTNTMLSSGLHFENFIYAWTRGNMGRYFLNSVIYAAVSVTGIILIAAPATYCLSRFKFFYNKVMKNLMVMALSIPQIMVVLPLYSLAADLGMLNSRFTLILLYICLNVPFCTFFLLSFFSTLSHTFEEAAAIDGCSPIQTFFKIMFPLAQPGLITVGIFLFMGVWNEFFIALIFAADGQIRPLAVGLYSLIQGMATTGKWAELFAAVVVVFLPTFIIYIFLSEKIIAGVTGGGVKE